MKVVHFMLVIGVSVYLIVFNLNDIGSKVTLWTFSYKQVLTFFVNVISLPSFLDVPILS